MFTTTYFEHKFGPAFDKKQTRLLAEAMVEAYDDLVKTRDFNELKSLVRDIAVIQKELTTGQQRTEQRVEELTTAQQRTEQRLEKLTTAQQELTIAQNGLTNAQQRTEQRLEKLVETQQRTEIELQQLIREHKDTRKQVGGLAITVGYRLEDMAYKALPSLLKRDFDLTVQSQLKRTYLTDNKDQELEVNITGQH